jgi:hypothetical protein
MISWSWMLIFSRWASSSSSSDWPSTFRSVVWAMREEALRKFSTFTTAAAGSTTRK